MLDATTADLDRLGKVDEAAGMRIVDVEPVLLSYTYGPGERQAWSGGTLEGLTVALVRITASDGITGVGETYAGNFAPEVARDLVLYFREYLLGRDPSDIIGAWESCRSRVLYWGRTGISISVLSAIESALWDLCGKAVQRPVHQLLGTAHARLPRYASGGAGINLEALRDEQEGYVRDGFVASKIRCGMGAVPDTDKTRIAREALGPAAGLAVDAVQGSHPRAWTGRQAVEACAPLRRFELLWLEEPCGADDPQGYAQCRRELGIPIAGGETFTSLGEFRRFLDSDALDIVQPDAAHTGGILQTRKAGALAEAYGARVAVHAWSAGVCVMANYHAGFATPNCDWLEFPTQSNPLRDALMAEPLTVENGYVLPPAAPGLGVTLTAEIQERYPYKPGHHYKFGDRR